MTPIHRATLETLVTTTEATPGAGREVRDAAEAVRAALAQVDRLNAEVADLRSRAIPKAWVDDGELDIKWRRDGRGVFVWGFYGKFSDSVYVENEDGSGYTTGERKHPTLAAALAAAAGDDHG